MLTFILTIIAGDAIGYGTAIAICLVCENRAAGKTGSTRMTAPGGRREER